MEQNLVTWPELRGGTRDDRPNAEKPYSAASYCAQFGIPLEDARDLVAQYGTHGEILQCIYKEHIGNAAFNEASRNAIVRPYSTARSAQEKLQASIDETSAERAEKLKVELRAMPAVKHLDDVPINPNRVS